MLSQGTVPLACRQGGLCPEHTGPVRLDGAAYACRSGEAPRRVPMGPRAQSYTLYYPVQDLRGGNFALAKNRRILPAKFNDWLNEGPIYPKMDGFCPQNSVIG
jgi:hypothetical protein